MSKNILLSYINILESTSHMKWNIDKASEKNFYFNPINIIKLENILKLKI